MTHETATINSMNSKAVNTIRRSYDVYGNELMKLFLLFYVCKERWAIHTVIQSFFFKIYISSFRQSQQYRIDYLRNSCCRHND